MTRIRMIAVDLDGTLLDRRGRITADNRQAIERAAAAGLIVAPCTGRSWPESRRVLVDMPSTGAGIFVDGSVVYDFHQQQAQHLRPIEPQLVLELIAHLSGEPEAVLLFRNGDEVGHDYLVTGIGELTP